MNQPQRIRTPFEDRVVLIASDFHDTLLSKNSDYGDSYARSVEKHGNTVVLIRLEDKLNRLERLLKSDSNPRVQESIEDTLRDLMGYAGLELERRMR